ncbi:replication initiation protein (plasmid) [Haloimpatiens sp. FM7330]|uniref:replication initiation protein n=1 Tax=Haloimpatiens sp. FM7330 TaxID=3298610 RepID=UPI0036377976
MITDLQNIKNNWIYQSNRLIESSYTLTVTEQKLIRLLASNVKKDDSEFTEYKFETKELIKVLNTSSSRFYRDIDNITDLLMQRVIKIKNIDAEEFEKYHWVEVCKYKNGILTIKINKEMKPFYLSLDWYTKYQLKNILQFKSTYSFRLYEILKQYEKIGIRKIELEKLRHILDIKKNQYTRYANLKQKIINKAQKEINTKTDINFDFEEIKTGRKVTSIKFIIHKNKTAAHEAAVTLEDTKANEMAYKINKDIETVQKIFSKHPITKEEALDVLKDAKGDMDLIKMCYQYSLTKDLDNIVGYMRILVRNFNDPKENIKKDSFNDYEQRDYDYGSLEKKLLGWDKQ